MSRHLPVNFSNAWNSGERILNNAISLLPNLIIALVIFVVFIVVAAASKSLVRHFLLGQRNRKNLALLMGQLIQTIMLVLGFLIAFSVIAPSFQAADIVKMLGIGSVAVGFAFQNILQNFLAGILLLIQEPFTLGDWISVTGIEGRVQDIQTRATLVTTQDGKLVVIPNAVLYMNPVSVGETKKTVETITAQRSSETGSNPPQPAATSHKS